MNGNGFIALLMSAVAVVVATTVHGYTKALVSTKLGDVLPKQDKQLTLNPIAHFEPIGFILMLYTGGFGWGKPVETSGLYYKNRKQGVLLTAILPSVANLVLGLVFFVLVKKSPVPYQGASLLYLFFVAGMRYNIMLAICNLLPIPPMDCVKVLSVVLPANQYFKYLQYEKMIQIIVILLLGVFGRFLSGIYGLVVGFFDMLLFFV